MKIFFKPMLLEMAIIEIITLFIKTEDILGKLRNQQIQYSI